MSKKSEAKKARKSAERRRDAADVIIKTGKVKGRKASKADIDAARVRKMKNAKEMRKQGDTLRDISGREKGQRTTYTGPVKQKTIDLIKKTTGDVLPDATKWQKVNKAWQDEWMKPVSEGGLGLTRAQARTRLKTLFSKNRERFLEEQQQRYDDNIVADVIDTDTDLDLGNKGKGKTDGRIRTSPTGGRGEYLATKYDRPGLLDWSHLAPPEMPGTLGTAPAQQSLLDRGLAAYQTWRRPGEGEALKYQPATAPTYATRASLLGGVSPSVSDTGGDTTTDNGDTTKTGATSGTFMGQPYANQGEYMRLLDTHNKAMQLIRGSNGQQYRDPITGQMLGIGALMGRGADVNRWYMSEGGTDIKVGGESASLADTLLGRTQDATTQNQSRQNQLQDLRKLSASYANVGGPLSASNTLTQDQRMALSNVPGVRAPLAAPAPAVASAPRFTNYVDPLLLQQTNAAMANQGMQNAYLAGVTGVDPQFSGSFPGMDVGLLGPR